MEGIGLVPRVLFSAVVKGFSRLALGVYTRSVHGLNCFSNLVTTGIVYINYFQKVSQKQLFSSRMLLLYLHGFLAFSLEISVGRLVGWMHLDYTVIMLY